VSHSLELAAVLASRTTMESARLSPGASNFVPSEAELKLPPARVPLMSAYQRGGHVATHLRTQAAAFVPYQLVGKHAAAADANPPLCRFFERGICRKGRECPFRHAPQAADGAYSVAAPVPFHHMSTTTTILQPTRIRVTRRFHIVAFSGVACFERGLTARFSTRNRKLSTLLVNNRLRKLLPNKSSTVNSTTAFPASLDRG
jgi:hypothetical protein